MQVELFLNFTSILYDYLLIAWVTNYAYNPGFFNLFIVSWNFAPKVAMAILWFHVWNYKLTLKFRAKIKE